MDSTTSACTAPVETAAGGAGIRAALRATRLGLQGAISLSLSLSGLRCGDCCCFSEALLLALTAHAPSTQRAVALKSHGRFWQMRIVDDDERDHYTVGGLHLYSRSVHG